MSKFIRPGALVFWRSQAAIVLELKNLSEAIIRLVEKKSIEIAAITELSLSAADNKATSSQKHMLTEKEDWDKAMGRLEIIRPLLQKPGRTQEEVKLVADQAAKSPATIYRWLERFEKTGLVSSLLRNPREDKGLKKLSPEIESIISRCIETEYLREERPPISKLIRAIETECESVDLQPPNRNTVYNRIYEFDRKTLSAKRFGPKITQEKFAPFRGSFPGADFLNAVVQIDHTKMDVILVDEMHRLPIGRPYLTICIEIATRMISGFVMTLDPPSALSAGLCIAHAVSKKDYWLAKRDITAEWPIFGKMEKIHVDNGKEFHSRALIRACDEYGIILENRPKKRPNYGPHVERAFLTFMKEVQTLPGTTFSNVRDKLNYDSEGRACLTLAELDLWFSIFVVYCYHNMPHSGITDIPPIRQFEKLVFGTDEIPGTGLPAPIEDEQKFRLDFLPFEMRTIQRDGAVLDHVKYYSDVLRKWIDAIDPEDRTKTRKFIFARDPRDISVIYFLDPDTESYAPIPYLDNTRPAISLWELKAAIKQIEESPYAVVNEENIFKGVRLMREIEVNAIEATRLAKNQRATEKRRRRTSERRKGWSNVHSELKEKSAISHVEENSDDTVEGIEPFSDIKLS